MTAKAQFANTVNKWARRTGVSLGEASKAVTIEMFTRVIRRSPVDTGAFRAGWQVDQSGFSSEKKDPSGVVTIAEMTARVKAKKLGGITALINSAPYALRLEYGYSAQAPGGMVRITAAEFGAVVRDKATGRTLT